MCWSWFYWVANEVLSQVRIHPLTPLPFLAPVQDIALHDQQHEACQTAVNVDADSRSFAEGLAISIEVGRGYCLEEKEEAEEEKDREGVEDVESAGEKVHGTCASTSSVHFAVVEADSAL
ncbi:hypothetical protein IAR50_006984 [Cryptococcus sp. DSM 104548]